MKKRSFDFVSALLGIIILSPLFIGIGVILLISGRGGIIDRQERVGRGNQDFILYKFRTRKNNQDIQSYLPTKRRAKDPLASYFGTLLRRFRLDDLPKLFNIIKGDVSFVGPKPEHRIYVDTYTPKELKVLEVRPGLTDLASIEYRNETDLLIIASNPEEYYIEDLLPKKINLSLGYIENQTFLSDIKILIRTIFRY